MALRCTLALLAYNAPCALRLKQWRHGCAAKIEKKTSKTSIMALQYRAWRRCGIAGISRNARSSCNACMRRKQQRQRGAFALRAHRARWRVKSIGGVSSGMASAGVAAGNQ